MGFWTEARRRAAHLIKARQFDRELEEEIGFHINARVEELVNSGVSHSDAVAQARREFGSRMRVAEDSRNEWRFQWLEDILTDLRLAVRSFARSPVFVVTAVGCLAVGIGANTLIFSLINSTLLRPLPFENPDRLMALFTIPVGRQNDRTNVNIPSYLGWKEQSRSFESMGAFFYTSLGIGAEENGTPAERLNGQYWTASLFETLGVKPVLGRAFTEEESQIATTSPAVVITDSLWRNRFNADPDIIGKTMRMDNVPHTIVGVMAPDFTGFQGDADFLASSGFTRPRAQNGAGIVNVIGRLRPGVAIEQAQAELDAVAAGLAESDPARNKGMGAATRPLHEVMYGGLRRPLLLLQGAVVFVLLIGCANVAALLLARAATRRTEVAIRTAIGAGRWRIVRQLLTESVFMAALGGGCGVFLAWGGLRLFIAGAPPGFPRLNELALDAQTMLFTALISVLTGLFFGIIPAVQASRTDLVDGLKDRSRSARWGRYRLRSVLVTVQIGLALVLSIGAGLMINSFVRIQQSNLGFDPENLLTFDFRFPVSESMKNVGTYRGSGLWEVSPNAALTFDRLRERLKSVVGVESIAFGSRPPLQGSFMVPFLVEGRPAPEAGNTGRPAQSAVYMAITPDYFATLKTPVVRGRDFTDRDNAAGQLVIIINEAMARRYWPDENPIGRRIVLDYVPDEQPREIIGIVADIRLYRTEQNATPTIYLPHSQQARHWLGASLVLRAGMFFVVRAKGDPLSLVPSLRQAAAEVDRNKPVAAVQTVEQTIEDQVRYVWLYVLLLSVFGGIAALLAGVGVYGVMAYIVAQRRSEIGLRMALGASARDVLKMMARQAAFIIGTGLVLGLAGSLALTRVLSSALWGVTATDPATFAFVSTFLVLMAALACFIPTRQASKVDPAVALRSE